MKKNLPIIITIVLITISLVVGFIWWRGRKAKEALPPSVPEGQLIETPLEDRPYVSLTPRADGREFTLEISRIKNTKTIEYELVYLTHGLSRGVIGTINLGGETTISRKLLLGTCSRNVCKYDEDVSEGTLTLRFRGTDGVRKFTSQFHLQQGGKQLFSIDGNFKLDGTFSSETFYLTMSTIGLPQEFEGKIVSGPYGVFTVGSMAVKKGKITLVMGEESPSAKLYAWTGKTWEEVEKGFETEGKAISAETDTLGTFIAIASE